MGALADNVWDLLFCLWTDSRASRMINEIFISKWAPVVPLPLMSPAQKDNELERIFERMQSRVMGNYNEPGGSGSTIGRFKRDPDREFDRGFEVGVETEVLTEYESVWLEGYEQGYAHGRDGEARHRDKS